MEKMENVTYMPVSYTHLIQQDDIRFECLHSDKPPLPLMIYRYQKRPALAPPVS